VPLSDVPLSDVQGFADDKDLFAAILPAFNTNPDSVRNRLARMMGRRNLMGNERFPLLPSLLALVEGWAMQRRLCIPLSSVPECIFNNGADDVKAYFKTLCKAADEYSNPPRVSKAPTEMFTFEDSLEKALQDRVTIVLSLLVALVLIILRIEIVGG